MKKKIFLFTFMFACLISVLVVSSGAVEWFGSEPDYTLSGVSLANFKQFLIDNGFTSQSNAFTAVSSEKGEHAFWYYNTDVKYQAYSTEMVSSGTFSFTTTADLDNSALGLVSEPGFVSSGFSSAIGFAGTIAGELLDNSTIIIAIGLAVAVTLVGWGIGKVKSLIKGY